MKVLEEFLKKHNTCEDGFEFAKNLTLEQFLNTCERGDWILWLFKRINPNDKRARILVAAHCANTVRHLMKDDRSKQAVDVAIKYGDNQATDGELAAADDAAYAAADDAAYAAGTDTAAFAATTAAYAAAYAAADDAATAGTDTAAFAATAARKVNQKLTADICRQYLPIEIWNKNENIW